jgi:hypothetical protein
MLESRPRPPATGNCFETAAKVVTNSKLPSFAREHYSGDCGALINAADPDELTLVHAEITGQGPIEGMKLGHAWVETDSGWVIDCSNGNDIVMRRDQYYRVARVTRSKVHRYTAEETVKNMLKFGNYGPWDLEVDA